MKALAIFATVLLCATGAANARPAPADDPLRGVDLGMSQTELKALAEVAGATLDCRERSAIVNQGFAPVQLCTAVIEKDGGRIDAMLAPAAEGGARVIVFTVRGPVVDAASVRDGLVKKLGKPKLSPPDAAGFMETAKWQIGPRLLVHSDGCRRGQSHCIEYSQNAWARQAARAVGMDFALP
jgi:hypothetical protein